jgi:hypothetical protein
MTPQSLLIFALFAVLALIGAIASVTGLPTGASGLMAVSLLFVAGCIAVMVLGIVSVVQPTRDVQPLAHEITPDGFVERSAEIITLSDFQKE